MRRRRLYLTIVSICLIINGIFYFRKKIAIENLGDNPYQYPVISGTKSWELLTNLDDKLEVCQIPQSILDNMETNNLVKSIVDNPLLGRVLYFNTYSFGYITVKNDLNCLQTLEDRGDASQCLLNEILSVDEIDTENLISFSTLAVIMAQPIYYDKLSNPEKVILNVHIELLYERYTYKNVFKYARDEHK